MYLGSLPSLMYVSSWPLILQVPNLPPSIILIDNIISIAISTHPLCMWLIVIVLSVTANTQETRGERLCEKGEAQSEKREDIKREPDGYSDLPGKPIH